MSKHGLQASVVPDIKNYIIQKLQEYEESEEAQDMPLIGTFYTQYFVIVLS